MMRVDRPGRRRAQTFLALLLGVIVALGSSASSPAPAGASKPKTYLGISTSLIDPDAPAHYAQHPHRFTVAAADSWVVFKALRWHRWGAAQAVAHGRATACEEGGIEGRRCESGRVRLVAAEIRYSHCAAAELYRRLTAFGVPEHGHRLELPTGPECGA
jgi:hypothetical protein